MRWNSRLYYKIKASESRDSDGFLKPSTYSVSWEDGGLCQAESSSPQTQRVGEDGQVFACSWSVLVPQRTDNFLHIGDKVKFSVHGETIERDVVGIDYTDKKYVQIWL